MLPASTLTTLGLDELHVLGHYWHPTRPERTDIGRLVHAAKDQLRADAAARLATLAVDRMPRRLAQLGGQVIVAAVPANQTSPVRLPHVLGRALADAGVGRWVGDLVARTLPTPRLRDTPPSERAVIVAAARYRAQPVPPGTTVVLVDDVVLTGTTLSHVAACLRAVGASRVVGFAIARTRLG